MISLVLIIIEKKIFSIIIKHTTNIHNEFIYFLKVFLLTKLSLYTYVIQFLIIIWNDVT
jgi:hypothetical protein